jgi:hypothetical protein
MKKIPLPLSLMLAATATWAQQTPTPMIEPPPPPAPIQSGEALEPEINIIKTEKGTIQQYRLDGRVYMVKVIPLVGAPYYLLDTDADGELDSQTDSIKNISVPQWVLFSW